MLIKVTEKDIERAKVYRQQHKPLSQYCPIALAVKRVFPDNEVVFVSPLFIVTQKKGARQYWRTPEKVAKFIEKFDKFDYLKLAQPFEFELESDLMPLLTMVR